jgi:hypothetical protein
MERSRTQRQWAVPRRGLAPDLLLTTISALAMFVLAGCGASGPEIAGVEGTVFLDGNPLPLAAVVFIPENGRPAGATTDAQGHYVLSFSEGRDGAIPGKSRVMITTKRDPWRDENGKDHPAGKEVVPMKYNAKSELEFIVEPGKSNVADFQLDSKGPISKDVDDLGPTAKPFADR